MKKPLSAKASAIAPSATLTIDAMYKKMQSEGLDVIGFGAGEPDFNTPDNVKAAGIHAIERNQTRYTPAAGTLELRSAIAESIRREHGVEYTPAQIILSSGAKHSLFLIMMTLCDPGDEVILPAPYWLSYAEMIRMAGALPVEVFAGEEQSFKITPAQLKSAITPKTKAIIFNSPSNPTGMVYSREELLALCNLCAENGVYIISDEIYDKLVYDGASAVCVPSLSEEICGNTILVNGVSKTYAMTGWRIGWTCAPKEIASVISSYQSHSTSAPATICQDAALEAIRGSQDSVSVMRGEFQRRRDYFISRVEKIDGVSALNPGGAFYIFMNIKRLVGRTMYGRTITCANDFARLFLETARVAVVPCESFGADGYVRWSYATSMENIAAACDRLESFIAQA